MNSNSRKTLAQTQFGGQKSQLNVTNPRGHEEDSGLHSHVKNTSTITTKNQFMALLRKPKKEKLTLRRESYRREGESSRWRGLGETGDSPGLFIRHITYSPDVLRYF
jgi:hypothetical protein